MKYKVTISKKAESKNSFLVALVKLPDLPIYINLPDLQKFSVVAVDTEKSSYIDLSHDEVNTIAKELFQNLANIGEWFWCEYK